MSQSTSRKRRILVIQLADLGDLVLAAPAIAHLRNPPDTEVTLLTKPANNPLAQSLADRLILVDKHVYDHPSSILSPSAVLALVRLVRAIRSLHFDQVIVLHHLTTRFGAIKFAALTLLSGAGVRQGLDNGRGWFLTDRKRDLGFGAAPERTYWHQVAGGEGDFPVAADRAGAGEMVARHGVEGAYAVVHPGSGTYSLARRWPSDYFAELARLLHEIHGLRIVLVGTWEERAVAETVASGSGNAAINIAGETNLPALAGVLAGARLFVGNDGGVAQLAQAVSTPSIVIFGPTSPATWYVPSPNSRAIRRDIACSPCVYHHFELGTPEGCSTRECLLDLSPRMVARQAEELLRARVAA